MNLPKRYVPKKLTDKDKKKQQHEIKKSRRSYKKGKYYTRKKVKSFKSKESAHVIKAKKIYNIKNISASRNLAKKTGCSISALKQIVKKGQGAYYSSGSRPNQTGHSWGRARLASTITGGKAAAVDYKILEAGCKHNSKALKLAKRAKKGHGHGTRRVPKHKGGKRGKKRKSKKGYTGGSSQYEHPAKRHKFDNTSEDVQLENDNTFNEETRVSILNGRHQDDTGTVFSILEDGRYEVYLDNFGGEVLFTQDQLEILHDGGRRRKKRRKTKKLRSIKMKEGIVRFKVGPGDKKYTAYVENKKTKKVRVLHFGHKDYEQYKDRTNLGLYSSRNHGNKKRQENYYNRHSGEKNRRKAIEKEKKQSKGYYTPKILSHIYLW
jgi:hypothetical protein